MTTIQRGDEGDDFLNGHPDPDQLVAHGIKFSALYHKAWSTAYVDDLHAHDIAVLPIVETVATMMFGGAVSGTALAIKAVADCHRYGIPEGTTIIFSHDTGRMNSNVVGFCVAAEKVSRGGGFNFGGYGGRWFFDQCMTAGVRFDLIWATNATAWLGGRHPDAHVWQGKYLVDGSDKGGYDVIDGVAVDKDVCVRPFEAWGPQAPTPPKPNPHVPTLTELGGDMLAWACIDPANPTRWLWNGYVMKRYASESAANQATFALGTVNDIQHPMVMAAADFAQFPEV